MKSLKEQIMGKCKHFNGVSNDACKIGIKYADVKVMREPGKGYSLPCLLEGKNCDKCEPYTEAEADAKVEAHRKRFQGTMVVRALIVENLGGPWKKGMLGASGNIKCPICENGTVAFSRSGYNGHIHAHCSTKDCVSWME